jgi:hypothetical protein
MLRLSPTIRCKFGRQIGIRLCCTVFFLSSAELHLQQREGKSHLASANSPTPPARRHSACMDHPSAIDGAADLPLRIRDRFVVEGAGATGWSSSWWPPELTLLAST